MNWLMGSSGDTAASSSDSCTQPKVSWSRATFTQTLSMESVGTVRISATTRCSWRRRVMESTSESIGMVSSPVVNSAERISGTGIISFCCSSTFSESWLTTKL